MVKNYLFKCLIALLCLISANAFAVSSLFSGGTGTSDDPYQIGTAEDLIALSLTDSVWSRNFVQTADILFDEDETVVDWDGTGTSDEGAVDNSGFSPIGSSNFTGTYDGQGYTIYNIYIDRSALTRQGLFQNCDGATLKNIHCSGFYSNNKGESGALVGYISGATLVENCSVVNTITNSAGYYFAGFIGKATGGTIKECYVDATVTASGKVYGGLFVGYSLGDVTYNNCYANGDIAAGGRYAGFSGRTSGATFTNCYVAATLGGATNGGFIGRDEASNTYVNCFYDSTLITGAAVSYDSTNPDSITPVSTEAMKMDTTFVNAGWDFTSIWEMDAAESGYPILRWQNAAAATVFSGGAGTTEDPYQISTVADLIALSQNDTMWSKAFIQTADIAFNEDPALVDWNGNDTVSVLSTDSLGFNPINLTGSYNGQGNTISNLYMNHNYPFQGMFGQCDGATIENLMCHNFQILQGDYSSGLLVGRAKNGTTINKCGAIYSSVSVSADYSGAFIGDLTGGSTISNCFADLTVTTPSRYAAILVADCNDGNITNCYAKGTVNGGSRVGGLVGFTTNSTVSNSYAAVTVTGSANLGGLVGRYYGSGNSYSGCFYDYTICDATPGGFGSSAPGTGVLTAGMQTDTTFVNAGWDFESIWKMDTEYTGYPVLTWQDLQASAPSTDASVASISSSVGELTPAFHTDTFTYAIVLPAETTEVPTMTVKTNHFKASVNTVDATQLPGQTVITVTAQDGTTQLVYTINLSVATGSMDATLASITPESGELSPAFDAETELYTVILPLDATSVPDVTALANDSKASVDVAKAASLDELTVITVTAEDTAYTKTYNVGFHIGPKKEIVFVKTPDNDRDLPTITAIKEYKNGTEYNVTVLEENVVTTDRLNLFNGADVVVMGRSIPSSDVGSAKDVWDAVTSPIISMNMYGLRNLSSKAYWVNSGSCENGQGGLEDTVFAQVLEANDPAMAGISETTIPFWKGYYSAFVADDSNADEGNGTLLLKSSDNRALFIRWKANMLFYPGADHAPKGLRSYIGLGDDATEFVNYYGFTTEGATVFFNELANLAAVSTDATLSTLTVSTGTFDADFAPETETYALVLPYGTTEQPTFTAGAADGDATVVITPATAFPGQATVKVTAEDSTTTITYTVNISVEEPRTDATLASLSATAGTFSSEFDAETLVYTLTLPVGTTEVPTITFAANDDKATVVMDTIKVLPDTATITVTAEDPTISKTYTVYVEVEPKKEVIVVTPTTTSNDTAVVKAISNYMDGTVYNVTVLPKAILEMSDTTQLNAADVVIMGRNIGSGDVGTARAAWDAVKAPVISMNPWGLRGRSDKGAWTPAYDCDNVALNDTIALTASIEATDDAVFSGITTDSIDWWFGNYSCFRADAEGDDAGNGQLLAQTSDKRPLFIRWAAGVEFYEGAGHTPQGDRTFIGCGSDNGGIINYFGFSEAAEKVFFAELARLASGEATVIPARTNAFLSKLTSSVGVISPAFDAEVYSYNCEVPFGTTEVPTITATTADSKASAVVTDAASLSNYTVVMVTAEDIRVKKAYMITFSIAEPNTDATLATLTTSAGQYLPEFDAATTEYTVYLPAGTTEVPTLSATSTDENASVDVAQAASLSETATITVTAEDVTVSKAYTVTFTVVNGIDDNTLSGVEVYPNPATNFIKVSNADAGTISIISLTGSTVKQTNFVSDGAIDVSTLEAGVYMIKLSTKDGISISKFVKN